MANQSINLNLIPSGIAEVARVSQFDVGRVLTFTIYQGTDIFTPPSGTSIEVHVQKGDKKICIYTDSDGSGAVSLSGSTITLTTTLQMAAASGEATLQFRLKKNGQDIGTLNCSMMVQRDPAADGDISDSELPAIIDQASEQMERAEAAALAASNSAEAAATSATNAGTAASNAGQAATRAEAAASVAEEADLNPPYIGQNGNWYTFDLTTRQYKDTGIAARGDTGAAGNGIQNIQKTGTSGLVDSYRINYTNGGHFDYTVTNGKDGAGGVSSVNNVAPVQGNVTLTKSNIGLGNVDNTADANKSVAKATGDQSGNNIKASYGASLSYSNNVLSLLNKNGGVISSQTIQAGGVTSVLLVDKTNFNVSYDRYTGSSTIWENLSSYKFLIAFTELSNGIRFTTVIPAIETGGFIDSNFVRKVGNTIETYYSGLLLTKHETWDLFYLEFETGNFQSAYAVGYYMVYGFK